MPKLRKDPPSRGLGGMLDWNDLKNRDPDRQYVWVHQNGYPSIGWYISMGYKAHTWSKEAGATQPLFGDNRHHDGEEIVVDGSVLMSIEKERHEEIVQFGAPGGATGQRSIDLTDAYMKGPEAMRALAKGAAENKITVTGAISPLQPSREI